MEVVPATAAPWDTYSTGGGGGGSPTVKSNPDGLAAVPTVPASVAVPEEPAHTTSPVVPSQADSSMPRSGERSAQSDRLAVLSVSISASERSRSQNAAT